VLFNMNLQLLSLCTRAGVCQGNFPCVSIAIRVWCCKTNIARVSLRYAFFSAVAVFPRMRLMAMWLSRAALYVAAAAAMVLHRREPLVHG
jgi:hypothetical protein